MGISCAALLLILLAVVCTLCCLSIFIVSVCAPIFTSGGFICVIIYEMLSVEPSLYVATQLPFSTAQLSVGRTNLAATSVGTKVLFGGGYNGSYSLVVDIYESSNNTWSTATLSVARENLAAASVGTKVLF